MKIIIVLIYFSAVFLNYSNAQTTKEKVDEKCVTITVSEKKVTSQKAVAIKASVLMNEISPKMGELYGKLQSYLKQNEQSPSGAAFAVYYSFDPDGKVEFEAALPVSKELESSGEIVFKEYAEMKVLSATHVGPYDEINLIYDVLKQHAEKNRIQLSDTAWEIYLTDPNTEPDPNKYRTEVYFPIKE